MHRNTLTRGILAASIAAVLAGGYAHFDLPGIRQAHALSLIHI